MYPFLHDLNSNSKVLIAFPTAPSDDRHQLQIICTFYEFPVCCWMDWRFWFFVSQRHWYPMSILPHRLGIGWYSWKVYMVQLLGKRYLLASPRCQCDYFFESSLYRFYICFTLEIINLTNSNTLLARLILIFYNKIKVYFQNSNLF